MNLSLKLSVCGFFGGYVLDIYNEYYEYDWYDEYDDN